MKLIINSATKDLFGLWQIDVSINGEKYRYELASEYAHDRAMKQYRVGQYGRCLAVMNKYKNNT